MSIRRQAIIWTNDNLAYWRIYASLGNVSIFRQQNYHFENAVCKMAAILSRPQCVTSVVDRNKWNLSASVESSVHSCSRLWQAGFDYALRTSIVTQMLPICAGEYMCRLPHSPHLVVIGLSVGYETWPPIGWQHIFVIGWSKYRLVLHSAPLHYGLAWPVGIPIVFQTPMTVPLHSPNGRQMSAVRAVQVDCERV